MQSTPGRRKLLMIINAINETKCIILYLTRMLEPEIS